MTTQFGKLVSGLLLVASATSYAAGPPPPPPPKPGKTPAADSCGYPYGTAPALSSVTFSESDTLQAFSFDGVNIRAWYTDEHALTLGVRQVVVRSKTGTTTTNFDLTPFDPATYRAADPKVGTTALAGAMAGTDSATQSSSFGYLDHGRPMFPALFITDVTYNANNTAGDWQQSGINPAPPTAIYGTWKGAVRTVDQTRTPPAISITPDADPVKNYWSGIPDTPPSGFGRNEGYGAELVWNVSALQLIPGHTYRFQLMVHDGDQNKSGGDAGEACVSLQSIPIIL